MIYGTMAGAGIQRVGNWSVAGCREMLRWSVRGFPSQGQASERK